MSLSSITAFKQIQDGRWEWIAAVFQEKRPLDYIQYAICVVNSGRFFVTEYDAKTHRDLVFKSLGLPPEPEHNSSVEELKAQPEVKVKECSFCHGSGQTMGTPYDPPEPCHCGAKT